MASSLRALLAGWLFGSVCACPSPSKPFARFSFAWLNERELPEAVKRMAAARPVVQIKRSIQFRNCNAAGF
jgi:hypothetical protein